MKVTLESTPAIATINGTRARMWRGESASGVPVIAYIALIGVPDDQPEEVHAAFERELEAQRKVMIEHTPTDLRDLVE